MSTNTFRFMFEVSNPDHPVFLAQDALLPEGWDELTVSAETPAEARASARNAARVVAAGVARGIGVSAAQELARLARLSGPENPTGAGSPNLAAVIGGAAALHAILGATWSNDQPDRAIRIAGYQAALAGVLFEERLRQLLAEHAEPGREEA